MIRRPRVALVALVAVLACASRPPPIEIDLDGWHEVRLQHFVVLGNVPADSLRELAHDLALFDSLVRRITNARIGGPIPVRLYVFRSAAEAGYFTPPSTAGVMVRDLSGYFAFLEGGDAAYQARRVLLHEYAHYVIQGEKRVGYPRWYDEGLSEFLASARFRDDAVIVGTTLSDRVRTLSRLGLLPLEDLFDPGQEHDRGADVQRFYASAWALVHHLNASPEGRRRLTRFVGLIARGEAWRDAYEAAFVQSLPELQASLEAHVANLLRGQRVDFHLPLAALEAPGELSLTPVASAEVAYQLGVGVRLRTRAGEGATRPLAARSLFALASELDPGHVRARAALAGAFAGEGRFEEARSLLAPIQENAPDDAIVAFEAGGVAARFAGRAGATVADRIAARAALERAVALAPRSPDALAALGRFLASAEGAREDAIAALEGARRLGAWSPGLDLALARLHLAGGARDRAEALLRPVAADLHAGEAAAEARRILDSIRHGAAADS